MSRCKVEFHFSKPEIVEADDWKWGHESVTLTLEGTAVATYKATLVKKITRMPNEGEEASAS